MPALALLILVLLLAPLLAELMRPSATKARRSQDPANIAHLPKGDTFFQWAGPESGKVIVCIHGLSTPSYVFAATSRSLAALGYRVLTYDLYGRGLSARPTGRQDATFFTDQLRALLKHQGIDGRLSLLGFSMGGQIAAAFAAEEDARLDALVLIAPAGMTPADTTGQTPLWTAPLIGDWLTRLFGGMALRRELIEHRTIATVIPNLEDRQAGETRMRGFLPAVLSSRRHLLGRSSLDDHRRVHADETPVLAIWGAEDPVIPLSAMGALAQANPDAQHVQIPGAGHYLLQTHPSEVAKALKDFLAPDT